MLDGSPLLRLTNRKALLNDSIAHSFELRGMEKLGICILNIAWSLLSLD